MGIMNWGKKKNQIVLDLENLPTHIAIIPDGNGRWAKKRKLPRSIGHREGSMTLKKIVRHCSDIGIKYMSVYTFSTENWRRPKEEVDALMSLLLEFMRNAERELDGANVRIRVIGDVNGLSKELQDEVKRVEGITAANNGLCLLIALNYGGRDELLNAIKKISRDVLEKKIKIDEINESMINNSLYTSDIPEPDLLIRTSGEKRTSNFLIWQLSYTEFWFTDKLWPDVKTSDIDTAIMEFQSRNRRYGGI